MITTVNDNQSEILRNIAVLHTGGKFDCDPTYSTGIFYRGIPELDPPQKFDIYPQAPDVVQADCRELPLGSASLESIVYDPPFIHAHGMESQMGQRFGSYPTQHALRALYFSSMVEFYRILKPKGVLVFKCQDIVESGKQVMNHCHIWQMAHSLGFIDLDLFILTASSRLVGHNHHEQQHARKFHSYFWVFQKSSRG
jgi:hypothetical protein